jgi:hypothetical protein
LLIKFKKNIKEVMLKIITTIFIEKQEEIIKRIQIVDEAGALAVGIDIDSARLITMALKGQLVSPKTPKEIGSGKLNMPFLTF